MLTCYLPFFGVKIFKFKKWQPHQRSREIARGALLDCYEGE